MPVSSCALDNPCAEDAPTHAAALARAAALGIGRGDRVLSTLDWTLPAGLLDGLLAILAAPASLVHCAHADRDALPARRTTEHVTVELLATLDARATSVE